MTALEHEPDRVLLDIANRLLRAQLWKGRWAMLPRFAVKGKTLGIISLENVGAEWL